MNQLTNITIERLSHDGRGIAHIDNRVCFIDNALPGEIVDIQIFKRHKNYLEAKSTAIIKAAAERIKPECIHFGTCGGCILQHLPPERQIHYKQQHVLEQLKHFGKITPKEILPSLSADSWGYRHKARLSVKYLKEDHKILLGFREKRPHRVANIEHCKIIHPYIAKIFTELNHLILSLSQPDKIPQIEVAVGDTSQAMILRHLYPLTTADKEKIISFAKLNQIDFFSQSSGYDSMELLHVTHDDELLNYSLEDFGITYHFRAEQFSQVNPKANALLVKQALDFLQLSSNDQVLDLYCGVGNFTLAIAKTAKLAVGIEGAASAVTMAKYNMQCNHIDNAEFYIADLMKENLSDFAWLKKSYDKIILDPPRSGALEILDLIGKMRAKCIVYVSCNPATFARDCGTLQQNYNYQLDKLILVDMFPHTSHIETIGLLNLRE